MPEAGEALFARLMSATYEVQGAMAQIAGDTDMASEQARFALADCETQLRLQANEARLVRSPGDLNQLRMQGLRQVEQAKALCKTAEEVAAIHDRDTVRKSAAVAGGVASGYAGKAMSAGDYADAVRDLIGFGRKLMGKMRTRMGEMETLAETHGVDINRSQEMQKSLLAAVEGHQARGEPVAAGTKLAQVAVLSLKDAEDIQQAAPKDAGVARMHEAAKAQAVDAARQAVDAIEVDARFGCSQAGKTGHDLEACTIQGRDKGIGLLRMQIIDIQIQVQESPETAIDRANEILREVAPMEGARKDNVVRLGDARRQAEAAMATIRSQVRHEEAEDAPSAAKAAAQAQAATATLRTRIVVAQVAVVSAPAETPSGALDASVKRAV